MAFLNLRGLFESIFGKHSTSGSNLPVLRLLSSYDSSFTPFNGRAWDIGTVRSAVDAWARNAAKIQPRHIRRAGGRRETVSDSLERILQVSPNPYMTAYAFYYRVAAQFIHRLPGAIRLRQFPPLCSAADDPRIDKQKEKQRDLRSREKSGPKQ